MSAPVCNPIPLRIASTGQYVPSQRVDAAAFDQRWGKPDGWTRRHSGVASRQFAQVYETTSFMGAAAARQALATAGTDARQIDCIISACSVMEQAIPCSGALLQRELGLGDSGIPAFDINATCLSFLTALDLAALALAAHRYHCVLVVSSEMASAGLDWNDTQTAALFGDGAAAVVLDIHDDPGGPPLLGTHMETYADGAEFCRVRAGGTRLRASNDVQAFLAGAHFEMNGKAVYRQAAQRLPGFLQRLMARAGTATADLQWLVPHQASGKALHHLQRALALPEARLVRILEDHGNQMAASIPVALHQGIVRGQIQRGDQIALLGSGAGLAFGGAVLRY